MPPTTSFGYTVNRELISRMARMTRKIQAAIARMWGEDAENCFPA